MNTLTLLSGRCALVTGATQGLGREIARSLLTAGAKVAFCARSKMEVAEATARFQGEFSSERVFGLALDIGNTADVDDFYNAALKKFGDINIVINNAAIHGPIGKIDEVDWDEWEKAIRVDLLGTAYSCRKAIAHFKSRGSQWRSKIVNLSGGGATSPQPGLSAYGAAKAGVVRLTETLSKEVQAFGIDMNAVAPGALATRMMTELRTAGPELIGIDHHSRVEQFFAKGGTPLERAADLCVYLASSNSDGITGRLLAAVWDPWPFTLEAAEKIMAHDIYTLRRITAEERGQTL